MLSRLPPVVDPRVLVGIDTGDDAAVYQLSDDLALVQTVDFFPPIVDDPYTYGAIAAANAVSDIYAMGATPLIALNIVAFPVEQPKRILQAILSGGADKAREAGVLILGGHTVDDKEPKYGMMVTGMVKPGCQITNSGARPGDVLVLTKPIGVGAIATAAKMQDVDAAVLQGAIDVMLTLNKLAAEAVVEVGVNAATDVTGFSLLGHLRGMMLASRASARIFFPRVPLIQGAWDVAVERGIYPGGTMRNRKYYEKSVSWDPSVHPLAYRLLYDPQTSGGLLLSVPRARADALVGAILRRGVSHAAIIGEVIEGQAGSIHIAQG